MKLLCCLDWNRRKWMLWKKRKHFEHVGVAREHEWFQPRLQKLPG
ncbi:MAG TPA: hypothetical protein VK619_07000 [Pyrinomonadaceae bacterium]|nr:hypothetical protein [Pyrinomonadaceae bacterium]